MDTGYLVSQVQTITSQLHELWDELGVPKHERDSREAEVCACEARICSLLISPALLRPLRNPAQPTPSGHDRET